MWTALGEVLPLSIGLALSPFAIVTGIVLLLGRGGRLKTALFGVGWFVAILVIASVAYWIVDAADDADHDATETGVDVVQLLIAVLFFALAYLAWRKRPKPGAPATENKLLKRLDGIGVGGALGIGLAQGFLVIKNLPLALGAGASLGEAGLSGGAAIGALLLFSVIATAGVLVPWLVAVFGGDRISGRLTASRDWMERNTAPITIAVLVILGALFLGQGLSILE